VTPFTTAAVDELTTKCPCGDATLWGLENPRRLTTCPKGGLGSIELGERVMGSPQNHGPPVHFPPYPNMIRVGTCKMHWNWESDVGSHLYGNMIRLDRSSRMSEIIPALCPTLPEAKTHFVTSRGAPFLELQRMIMSCA
jgi:hypothetical protein